MPILSKSKRHLLNKRAKNQHNRANAANKIFPFQEKKKKNKQKSHLISNKKPTSSQKSNALPKTFQIVSKTKEERTQHHHHHRGERERQKEKQQNENFTQSLSFCLEYRVDCVSNKYIGRTNGK